MTEWISVKKETPNIEINGIDEFDKVLICYKQTCDKCKRTNPAPMHGIGYYADDKWYPSEMFDTDYYPHDVDKKLRVTHWMKLPDLPDK